MNTQRLIIITAAACLLALLGVTAYSADNQGDKYSVTVRRPQPNQEFIRFAPAGGVSTNSIVWNSALNRISGYFLEAKIPSTGEITTLGANGTNVVRCTTSGNTATLTSSIIWQTNVVVDLLLVE